MDDFRFFIERDKQSATIKTNSILAFNHLYHSNELSSFGITYPVTRSISLLDKNETSPKQKIINSEIYVPYSERAQALKDYKTARKVIAIEEIDRTLINEGILMYIKEYLIDLNATAICLLSMFFLLLPKNDSIILPYAILLTLSQLNISEVHKFITTRISQYSNLENYQNQLENSPIYDIIDNPPEYEDTLLYIKTKGPKVRLK